MNLPQLPSARWYGFAAAAAFCRALFAASLSLGSAWGETIVNNELTTSVSRQYGTTLVNWQFSCGGGKCFVGRFITGDYWIAPKTPAETILIEDVSPSGEENGVEINPSSGDRQGFLSCIGPSYEPKLNTMLHLPKVVKGNSSVVKSVANLSGTCRKKSFSNCCVERYDVLTVLDQPPEDGGKSALRPGFSGNEKRIFYLTDFDLSRLPSLGIVTPSPYRVPFHQIADRWAAPYVDHFMEKMGDRGRAFSPQAAMPDYGAEQAASYLEDTLSIMGEEDVAKKIPAVIALLQRGLDLYTSWAVGIRWPAGAGQQMGRKPPIVFFAALSKDESIRKRVMAMAAAGKNDTQEDGQVFLVSSELGGGGVPVWGDRGGWCSENNYWAQLFKAQRYAGAPGPVIASGDNKKTCGDPYGWIDGPAGEPGSYYMSCCSTGGFIAYALAMNLMPELCKIANDSELTTFVRRVTGQGVRTSPDPCAPPDPRESRDCNPAKIGETKCGFYGKTWGPDPKLPGQCIRNDNNGSIQHGRFPNYQGRPLSPVHNEPNISKALIKSLGSLAFSNCPAQ